MFPWRSHIFRGCLRIHLLCLLIIALFFNPDSFGRVYHVKADAVAPGNGSPDSPFTQIQLAASYANAGDTVLVHAGTYFETVKPANSGQAGPDGIIRYIYFIAAQDGIAIIKAQNNFCFLIGEVISFGQVNKKNYVWIEGFYLTRGQPTSTAHGSAIRTFSDYGVFIHNHIYDNDAGVFCEGNGNYEEYNNNRGNYIAHNVISNCCEAGVRIKHSSENDVVFNLFYNNGLLEPAGAVTFYCGIGNRVINNTFWNNRGWAVAVYNGTNADSCMPCSYSEVRDNIFTRSDPGFLLQVQQKTAEDSTSSFSHNLFWGPDSKAPIVEWASGYNEEGFFWNLEQYKYHAGQINPLDSTGVFFADPRFVNPWNLQFELLPSSPALDAGSRPADQAPFQSLPTAQWDYPPDGVFADSLTSEQSQFPDEAIVDLGYHHRSHQYSLNPILITEEQIHIFPNPFNGNGALTFLLPNVSYYRSVRAEIFDLQGRCVKKFELPDEPLNIFNLRWDARTVSSGNYIFVLEVDGKKLWQRITLLK